ncbi:MAG: hypothetical protein RL122_2444 [Pseudomonadota bacterium]|jgi:hypothetical protein
MKKQILSTCLAISLIANASYVSAATATPDDEPKKLSGEQQAALLGGILLISGIMSLHRQSVEKAEEVATEQATKTLEVKPGHTYLWSSGSNDTSPVIEYVESCTPAKQYRVTSKLVDNVAEVDDDDVTIENESCSKKYDSRKKSMSEQVGDPWGLKARHAKVAAEPKKPRKGFFELLGEIVGPIGPTPGTSSAKYSCQMNCASIKQNTEAHCEGMSGKDTTGMGPFGGGSPKSQCKSKASQASISCYNSCSHL